MDQLAQLELIAKRRGNHTPGPNRRSSAREIVGHHGHHPHTTSILWPALYEHLRAKGYSKAKAAAISNGQWNKKHGRQIKNAVSMRVTKGFSESGKSGTVTGGTNGTPQTRKNQTDKRILVLTGRQKDQRKKAAQASAAKRRKNKAPEGDARERTVALVKLKGAFDKYGITKDSLQNVDGAWKGKTPEDDLNFLKAIQESGMTAEFQMNGQLKVTGPGGMTFMVGTDQLQKK